MPEKGMSDCRFGRPPMHAAPALACLFTLAAPALADARRTASRMPMTIVPEEQ